MKYAKAKAYSMFSITPFHVQFISNGEQHVQLISRKLHTTVVTTNVTTILSLKQEIVR